MPTTFAQTIDGNEILAKRSQCDYAGADIQQTYATKSEVTTGLASKQDTISDLATIRSGAADGATAVQPGDLATVATTGAYSDLSGTPTIPPALSAGNGIDITNNVVSADVAAPLAINTDDEIWLKTGRGLDTQAGLQSDELEVRLSGTGGLMYDSNDDDGLAIQLAQYSGLEVQMNNGVQEGLNVLVDGTTIDKNASGELTVIGGGGGGTQADWTEDDPTASSYIENKPVPKTLTAGTGISITENASTITIANTAPDLPIGSWEDVSTEAQYNTTPVLAGGFAIKYNSMLKLVSVTADVNLDAGAANIFTWSNRLKPVANAFALGNGLTLYVSQTSLNQSASATNRWVNGVWMWPVVGE